MQYEDTPARTASQMKIAVRNLHRTGIGGSHPFHNYILGLLQSGFVTHLFFEDVSANDDALRLIRRSYDWKELGLDKVEIIFSENELASCDVLLSFDSRPEDFSAAVKRFKGIKIFHLMDYFWGEPLSRKIARLQEYGVTYVLSYGSPDMYDEYFKQYGKPYCGKVIPLPFGFGKRFVNRTPFGERLQKCIALGSVRPLCFTTEPEEKYKEQADCLAPEVWFHKFRRMLVEHKNELIKVMDSLLPEYPRYRDYDYDMVEMLNRYQAFVSDESIFYFPSAKTFEGPAAGCVMVCSTHPCFADLGFIHNVNCIMHREFDVADFKTQAVIALADQTKLSLVARAGEAFVRERYSHRALGQKLGYIITLIVEARVKGIPFAIAQRSYELYRDISPSLSAPRRSPTALRNYLFYTYAGGAYFFYTEVLSLCKRIWNRGIKFLVRLRLELWRLVRKFQNREPIYDWWMRKRFEGQYTASSLKKPHSTETQSIVTLREHIASLPEDTNTLLLGPERKWVAFKKELRGKLLDEDPRTFLSWRVIRNNMLYRAGRHELQALKNGDWERWRAALTEPEMTRQQPFYLLPEANENSVRQAYHLYTFERTTGIRITDFDTIVDFGGGYGGMCRLVHALGFNGTYVIFDLKEFSALQRFYCSLTHTPLPKTCNTIEELTALLSRRRGRTLLIATWSLSEVSPTFRDQVFETVHPNALLIAYQKDFGGVDNESYFSNLCKKWSGMHWSKFLMKYLPTERNTYLIGNS